MRIVGAKDRSAFEPDPQKAWTRGRLLDARLSGAHPAVTRGVTRGTHEAMMRRDEARMRELASRINRK